ncbi:non-specific lipid-transfer protein 1-like [Abrus precatorius]|uniref:Non-specific lipid-transfer protein n=1 Tax=Abrus precatorius TaxID=3816 RepID=A0A8B8L867_ABRPR|nr:non-specific lipid-transfer protein 1-like [Abrus precatorius]
MARVLKMACMVVMCMAVVGAPIMMVEAMTCSDVVQTLMPCLSYLTQGGNPSQECCDGVRTLQANAATTSDRQTVCNCLKSNVNNFGVNANYAQALPAQCHVNIPYAISPSTNCDDIRF